MAQQTNRPLSDKVRSQNAQRRAREAQRRQLFMGIGAFVAVVAVIAVMFVIKAATKDDKTTTSNFAGDIATAQQELAAIPIAAVPDSVRGSVGVARKVTGKAPLVKDGKPEVLYLGAEFCPNCASERWAMVTALSRFGTFEGLGETTTPQSEGSIKTWSFHGSSYTSDYVTFTPVEVQDADGKQIQDVTKEQGQLWDDIMGQRAYPFIDYGNKFAMTGASYDASVLSGMTFDEIAAAAKDATSKAGGPLQAAANNITATVCLLTNNQPAKVCGNSVITDIEKILNNAPAVSKGKSTPAGK